MALSEYDKIILNELIDHCVNNISSLVEFARIPVLRSMFKDKDGFDFSLGSAVTEIHMGFISGFLLRNKRPTNKEDRDEMFYILGKRIHEIKEAIFKCG